MVAAMGVNARPVGQPAPGLGDRRRAAGPPPPGHRQPAARPGRGVGSGQGPPAPDRRGVRAGRRHQPGPGVRDPARVQGDHRGRDEGRRRPRDPRHLGRRWPRSARRTTRTTSCARSAAGSPTSWSRASAPSRTCSCPRRPPVTPTSRTRCGTRRGSARARSAPSRPGAGTSRTFALTQRRRRRRDDRALRQRDGAAPRVPERHARRPRPSRPPARPGRQGRQPAGAVRDASPSWRSSSPATPTSTRT